MLPLLLWVRTFLLGADASAGRDALGLGSMSVQNSSGIQATGDIDANSHKITNLTAGSATGNAVEYDQMNTAINSAVTALDWKSSVKAATTGALPACTYDNGTSGVGATLTANSNGAFPSQDGQAITVNDRILVKNQASGEHNGIYKLGNAGGAGSAWVLTRSADADSSTEVTPQLSVAVEQGSSSAGYIFKLSTTGSITVGTTSLTFAQIGSLSLGSATPQSLGTASAGSSSAAAKDDHVHGTDGLVLADGTGLTGKLATTGRKLSVNAVSSSAAANASKDVQFVNCGTGSITLTLPASTGDGTEVCVKRIGSNSVNTLTIDGDGSETVEDFSGAQVASFTMVLGESVRLVAGASGKWYRI